MLLFIALITFQRYFVTDIRYFSRNDMKFLCRFIHTAIKIWYVLILRCQLFHYLYFYNCLVVTLF